jgi:Ca-activated chloride channel homolog
VTARWPGLLWGLLVVPVALTAYLLAQRRQVRYAVRFTNLDLLAEVAGRSPQWRRHLAPALYLLALAALLASLARPNAPVLIPREQATVMLVMDISGSMGATDVHPTRLAAAQQAATGFVRRLPSRLRVGLVAFGDTAHLLARPTTDRDVVYEQIASLRAGGATAMGDGLELALDVERSAPALALGAARQRDFRPEPTGKQAPLVVLLLSDGANAQSRTTPLDAAADARRLRVPVFTVALGTDAGRIDLPSQDGQPHSVPVPPDKATLRQIADTTGARFFAASTSRQLRSAYSKLGSRIGFVKEQREVTALFAAAGLLLMVAAVALSLDWFNRLP